MSAEREQVELCPYAVVLARDHVAKRLRGGDDESVVFSDSDSPQNARVSHLLAAYDKLAAALIEARAERDAARERLDNHNEAWVALNDAADTLRTQLAAAREALAEAEWVMPLGNSSESCSLCGNMKHWGHAEDCYYITAALSEAP